MLFVQAFGQKAKAPHECKQNDERRRQKRRAIIDSGQQTTNGRAEDKANAREATDQAKVFAAFLRLGNVRNIGKEDTKVAAGQTIDDAAHKENPDGAAKTKEQVAKRRAKQANE